MPKLIKKQKTIGIVGSRRRDTDTDFRLCLSAFEKIYVSGDTIVSGGCPLGADRFAEIIAKSRGITITIYYPRVENLDQGLAKRNARAAYAIINFARNSEIAKACDVLIALCAADRKGGTEDTVKKAIKLDKEVIYA